MYKFDNQLVPVICLYHPQHNLNCTDKNILQFIHITGRRFKQGLCVSQPQKIKSFGYLALSPSFEFFSDPFRVLVKPGVS